MNKMKSYSIGGDKKRIKELEDRITRLELAMKAVDVNFKAQHQINEKLTKIQKNLSIITQNLNDSIEKVMIIIKKRITNE